MQLAHSNLVWSADVTYGPMPVGFLYLVAIIDWYSTLRAALSALEHARYGVLLGGPRNLETGCDQN